MGITDLEIPGLILQDHRFGARGTVMFPNGYGLSIVPESDGKTYEVAVMLNGAVCYDSGITEDVLRYLTVDSIRDVAAVAANLPTSKTKIEMRAVFLTCAIYSLLPLLLLFLCNIVGSGFPLLPLLTGVAIYLGNRNRR